MLITASKEPSGKGSSRMSPSRKSSSRPPASATWRAASSDSALESSPVTRKPRLASRMLGLRLRGLGLGLRLQLGLGLDLGSFLGRLHLFGLGLGRLLLDRRVDTRLGLGAGLAGAQLADAGLLADLLAQVVELRAVDVADRGDLDLVDLRRVERERALDADAERLLADRERLVHASALALENDALEDLDAAALALDHLEVNANGVAGLELRHLAQLGPLELFDHLAHRKWPLRAERRW